MRPGEARRQARIKLGNAQRVRESLWAENSPRALTHIGHDVKYAFRTLRRTPGFSIIAVADGLRPALFGLGLGLVASFAVTRIFQSMLFGTRPLDPVVLSSVVATLLVVAVLACL